MTKYKTEYGYTEDASEGDISLCRLEDGCGCATKSVLHEDGTHFTCGKCGATK